MDTKFSVEHGTKFPFNDRPPVDKAETAVLGILADLTDRRGVGNELEGCDNDIKEEIVTALAAIVRAVYPEPRPTRLRQLWNAFCDGVSEVCDG